jgi:uncharacterized protein (TIGR00159 family)
MVLIDLSFLDITIWDVLDILIVGFLLFQVYKLLRGTVAIYILVGVVLLYVVWWLVRSLNMDLLSAILTQFVSVGVLLLAIIFQPELRKFLLFLGESAIKNKRFSQIQAWFPLLQGSNFSSGHLVDEIVRALGRIKSRKEGALIVLSNGDLPENAFHSGVELDAKVSSEVIESIFWKNSVLHDGSTFIEKNRISRARCVLPLSQRKNLPGSLGLRHRAGIGISEIAPVLVIILSEETGELSLAEKGILKRRIDLQSIGEFITTWNESQGI